MSSTSLDPYAEQHKAANGPGDARPTAMQIIEDNERRRAWSDKVVVITGATSGIGVETARAMYASGAKVYLMVRNPAKMEPIVADIVSSVEGGGTIDVIEADLDSLESVKKAARVFLEKSSRLNVLINNAGIMACDPSTTADGFERQWAVNYLAHFTLTTLLLPTLISSSRASPSFNSRIVWVSSSAHIGADVPLDEINAATFSTNLVSGLAPETSRWMAYARSKLCMIWGSNHVDRLYGAQGVHSVALCPGGIWSGLQNNVDEQVMAGWKSDPALTPLIKSPAQGAATQVWGATATALEGKGGLYLASCKVATREVTSNPPGAHDMFSKAAFDPVREARLWEVSLQMAGVQAP